DETVAANLRERGLGRVELLLGFEDLEVTGEPLTIASRRMVHGLRERVHGHLLSRLGFVQLAQRGEGVRDFAERAEDGLLVLKPCLLPLRDGRAIESERAAHVEEWPAEHAGAGPDHRRSRYRRQVGAGRAE